MREKHFKELLTSVRQMGDHLKGKKVQGVLVSFRPKPDKKAKNVNIKTGR